MIEVIMTLFRACNIPYMFYGNIKFHVIVRGWHLNMVLLLCEEALK